MHQLIKTTSDNPDFRALVAELDAHLTEQNGDKDAFYVQFNNLDAVKHAIMAYQNDVAVGCGAIKAYSNTTMEVKRMYVKPDYRGQGIASDILKILENWAISLGYKETILETLKSKESVIALYERNGYSIMPNYGQYADVETSVCMHKKL